MNILFPIDSFFEFLRMHPDARESYYLFTCGSPDFTKFILLLLYEQSRRFLQEKYLWRDGNANISHPVGWLFSGG